MIDPPTAVTCFDVWHTQLDTMSSSSTDDNGSNRLSWQTSSPTHPLCWCSAPHEEGGFSGRRASAPALRFVTFKEFSPKALVEEGCGDDDTYLTARFELGAFVKVDPKTLTKCVGVAVRGLVSTQSRQDLRIQVGV